MRDIVDVTDDILKLYERVKKMFSTWTAESHNAFIAEMLTLSKLERELEEMIGDWDTVHLIVTGVYRSVFLDFSYTLHCVTKPCRMNMDVWKALI